MAFWDNRRIAYVYYLHRRPRTFTGGDLVLYPPGADPVRIRPAHNAFVAFPPDTEHEVGPVRCDPDDWGPAGSRSWDSCSNPSLPRRDERNRPPVGAAGGVHALPAAA